MAELKTKPTTITVEQYLTTVPDEIRRADARQLIASIERITKRDPVMWGTGIVGFGSYHYKYASGHEGDSMKIGLAARKEHLVLYGVIYYAHNTRLLDQLGKYKQGKGCLYIKKLTDINLAVLEEMIESAWSQKSPAEAV